jgi:hypothetical protein
MPASTIPLAVPRTRLHAVAAPMATALACLAFLPGLAAAAAPVRLTLHPAALVEQAVVRLGDVAAVDTDDADLAQELQALELGRIDAGTRRYARLEIARHVARRLQQRGRAAAAALEWAGAPEVQVRRSGGQLDGERIVAAARAALQRRLEGLGLSATLQPLRRPGALPLPAGDWTLAAQAPAVLRETLRVQVDVSVDGHLLRSVPVWFALSAADGGPLPAPGQGAAPVQRGARVSVELQQGAIRLERAGMALADARIGQRARVLMEPSANERQARAARPAVLVGTVAGHARVTLAQEDRR